MDGQKDETIFLEGKEDIESSEQHLERPKPLSLPPQEPARWDNRFNNS